MSWLFFISAEILFFCAAALILSLILEAPAKRARQRLVQLTEQNNRQRRRAAQLPQERLLSVAKKLRSLVGIAETPKLRDRFMDAGIHAPEAIEVYFGVRMLGPIAGILAGTFIASNPFFFALCLGVAAYMAPEFWLDRRIKKRRDLIKKSLPDSIDLLVICVDAGLGLDQAMLRVGQELAVSHPQINEEFMRVNREQRAGRPRIEAWKQMALRTKLPDINGFVNMLVQTERFGTPIARALSSFADDLRLKRKQRVEEKAAKTTVKMLFPLVLFIFPCIFIVLLGPAMIAVSKGLFNMTR